MNILRAITYIPRRALSRKNSGIKSKLRILKQAGFEEPNLEELDGHDLDEFEADFMHADEFHKDYEQEKIKAKQLLKKRIVASKYFTKDKDPNFLTSIEKDQIRKLHESNPEEWTVEVLSKSFPALPETIKKILNSKWSYESIERVLKYDATVVDNWKLFKAGKLPVSPALREHLAKFQNRKIMLPDRHLLAEKLVPPKAELPKPKSTFFSNIVQSYLDQETSNQNDNKVLPSGKETMIDTKLLKDTSNNAIAKNLLDKRDLVKKELLHKNNTALVKPKANSTRPKITFNEFAKKELTRIYAERTEEAITLLHAYQKYINKDDNISPDIDDTIIQSKHVQALKEEKKEDEIEVKKENLSSWNVEISNEKKEEFNSLNLKISNKEEVSISVNKSEPPQLISTDKNDTKLDTYVKERNSKISVDEKYSLPIQIPSKLYQKGKTYRISDCYYDDDGEFLYRVPGVRN
ncbi:PREDICTED: uncharacterized protein LOC107064020 [Polistes dominula]|uniref:Uncharacterized protein LOC107064020 n=1 Tax=Polistes dominula TaxID=743375 RepID=A0ABM1HUW7_POLDO|nr:PREDICTED: uncharacterized protein LOC107064020 [Polistes dominula]